MLHNILINRKDARYKWNNGNMWEVGGKWRSKPFYLNSHNPRCSHEKTCYGCMQLIAVMKSTIHYWEVYIHVPTRLVLFPSPSSISSDGSHSLILLLFADWRGKWCSSLPLQPIEFKVNHYRLSEMSFCTKL